MDVNIDVLEQVITILFKVEKNNYWEDGDTLRTSFGESNNAGAEAVSVAVVDLANGLI